LQARASVEVIAPRAVPQIQQWSGEGVLSWKQREFEPRDLDHMSIVITATPSREVNAQIFQEARLRNVLCNSVDDPENCDFYYPAVVQRGDLQIAISTNGRSPALAQRLRQELEQQFGPEYETWLQELGEKRDQLFATNLDAEARRKLLHELASREAFKNRSIVQRGRSN
jgi:precorrin-2 dehydrogenase/sirohydrochlorin ferrochelatase